MSFVYWIRKPDHNDMFSEGYIGITKRSVFTRYREHKSNATHKHTYLYNAINKYGDSLIVETLIECDLDYAYWLEEKLRPDTNIGWNKLPGGRFKVHELSSNPKSKAHRRAICLSRTGRKASDETKAKLSAIRKLHYKNNPMQKKGPASGESILKRERTRFFKLWERDPDIWKHSDIWYAFYLTGRFNQACENEYNLDRGSLRVNFNHFKAGWVPSDDSEWVIKFKENK